MTALRFTFPAFCRTRAPQRRRLPAAVPDLTPAVVADPADDADFGPATGCGWFDSSWHLQHGLQITELETTDAALPLGWWLAWQTAPQRVLVLAAAREASPSALN